MYHMSLLIGLLFVTYVVVLAYIVVKRRSTIDSMERMSTSRRPMNVSSQPEDLVPGVEVKDVDGNTVITWRTPTVRDFVCAKVYVRVSNNPAAAVSRFEIPKSDREFESITHNRNGKRNWYWITLVYKNGNESEKQFIDVVPNTDD